MMKEKTVEKKRYILTFPLETVQEPITYILVKEYDLKINIINANITPGKKGNLLCGIWGAKKDIEEGIKYLEGRNIQCTPVEKRLHLNLDKCIHCGSCTSVCFSGALTLDQESRQLLSSPEKCTICGLCVKACPLRLFEISFEEN
ncbi:MAG: 4Fe-4S binding protein [Bacteroidales bacterium]|nr:4Fe-4S binding protein [Bacteroidales bacterium]